MPSPSVARWSVLVLPLLFAVPSGTAAQTAGQPRVGDPDRVVAGGGALPEGWSVRPDEGTTANASVSQSGSRMHVSLGPAIILYRESMTGSGPFHTLATFTQTRNPSHPEGYGLFFGGRSLDGSAERYTYFLVRGDGAYLVKRRDGPKTAAVTSGWVPHPAVHKADSRGVATNLLEIDAKRDPSKIVYKVNGQAVYASDARAADLDGIVGLRINHNLDVEVDGFDVHR